MDASLPCASAGDEPRRREQRHPLRYLHDRRARGAAHSIFARKNYFYPDLPKGYQISQYEIPVVQGGHVEFFLGEEKKSVRLVRAHLEEDAGKSLHEGLGQDVSGIDLNRAGTPLLEIVSEPDMRSAEEAVAYAKETAQDRHLDRHLRRHAQEGSFPVRRQRSLVRFLAAPLGTRREIKNLNSFRFLQQAIEYEVRWQIEQIEDGHRIEQATVLFDPDTGETRAMRTKEDAADYRYFPDPDLPPLEIASEWIERVRAGLPELPRVMAARFVSDYGLPEYDATTLTQSQAMGAYFEAAAKASGQPKLASNWIMGEVSRRLNAQEMAIEQAPVNASTLAKLIQRIADGTVSNSAARVVFDALWSGEGSDVDAIIVAKGLKQMSDTGALEAVLDEVIAAYAANVEQIRAGKDKAFNALVGQAMKASKGKANPQQVGDLLRKKLGM